MTFTERLVALESALRKRLTNSAAGYKYRLRAFILRVLEPWDDPDQVVYDKFTWIVSWCIKGTDESFFK